MTDPIEQLFELDAKTDVAILDAILAEGDLAAVEAAPAASKGDNLGVTAVHMPALLDFTHELPPKYATDVEVQAALDVAMHGARLGQRCNLGPVTDTFVNGGNYAAGQSRWTQIPSFKTAAEEVELIKASFA